jgi:hypothetical protein
VFIRYAEEFMHEQIRILDLISKMGTINLVVQYIRTLFILFKHWFYCMLTFVNGGLPLKDVSSDIVLITGAASGIGKGVAQRFAALGCTLVLWDVDETNNQSVADELNRSTQSTRIHAMKCDLTKREHIYECARKVSEWYNSYF